MPICRPSGTKTTRARSASCAPCWSPRRWLKLEQRDLSRRAEPERRTPVAGSPAHIEPHRLQTMQSGDKRLKQPHEQIEGRSEEHTSELQSQFHLVCRLLLEKKKT